MKHLRAVNQKAQRIESNAEALKEDIVALQAPRGTESPRSYGMHHHLLSGVGG